MYRYTFKLSVEGAQLECIDLDEPNAIEAWADIAEVICTYHAEFAGVDCVEIVAVVKVD